MNDKKKDDIFSESDDFWDFDLLLPKTVKKVYSPRNFDTFAPDFNSDIKNVHDEPKGERIPHRPQNDYYPPITSKPKPGGFDAWLEERKRLERSRGLRGKRTVEKYTPETPLIKSVTVSVDEYPARTGERFLADAERLYNETGEFKGNVPFESYYSQYSQMTPEQIECYIGFRTLARKWEYPKVDVSYIYLYLYELINLVSHTTPEERAMAVCGLINGYHDCDSRLFSYMCNWLTDICLIYKVTLPDGIFGDNIYRVIECAAVKEFFIRTEKGVDAGIAFVLTSGRYDFRKSRFYPEYREFYDRHLNRAVCYALKEIARDDKRYSGSEEELCTLTRESYFGALCTSAVKRTITLECVCVTRSESVRKTVTELLKYAENILRKKLGIAPRLTVTGLTIDRKELIKRYYESVSDEFPTTNNRLSRLKNGIKPKEEMPDYEKLYEPKNTALSFEEAERIERLSWQVTEKLVIDEEDLEEIQGIEEVSSENISVLENDIPSEKDYASDKKDIYRKALNILVTNGSEEFKAFAKENGYIPDALADEINGELYESIFDIAIIIGDVYEVVSDYEEEIKAFINGEL